MIETLIIALHILVALALIIIVLFQQGSKGAAMGSAFGGSSQTLSGSRGPATALAKITTVAAVVFMVTSIALSILSNRGIQDSVVTGVEAPAVELPTQLPDKPAGEGVAPVGPTGEPEEKTTGPIGPVDKSPSAEESSGY